jgi:transposase
VWDAARRGRGMLLIELAGRGRLGSRRLKVGDTAWQGRSAERDFARSGVGYARQGGARWDRRRGRAERILVVKFFVSGDVHWGWG